MLAKASALGRGAVVRLLLDYGADVSVRDTEVHTYVHTYIDIYIDINITKFTFIHK